MRKTEEPRCVSWRDLAAARQASAGRAGSARTSGGPDRSSLERQNTFPSGIPKPVAGTRHRTSRQPHVRAASDGKPSAAFRKASLSTPERSPARNGAFRKNDEDDGRASAVTCKIRITPPNGPGKAGRTPGRTSPRHSGTPKSEDGEEKPRSRTRPHQHGMQSAVQKGDRQCAPRATGIPELKDKRPRHTTKKPDETGVPGTEENSPKTTWAQLRSKSVETAAGSAGEPRRRSQLPSRQCRSLDEPDEEPARFEYDLGEQRVVTGSTVRLDVGPSEAVSLPAGLQAEAEPRRPPLPPEGPVSLPPLPCEDEVSTLMCETSLPREEAQPRARSVSSPSKHLDLRLLAAFQRMGEEATVKEGEPAWMSDIEERDENSSSGASRAASEEPPDQERRSPRRLRAKGACLGLERLLETPRNVSVISIQNGLSPTCEDQEDQECSKPPVDGGRESSPGHGGPPSPFTGREQTSVTRRGAMNPSTPPAKTPPWEKSVTIETGAQTNCHLVIENEGTAEGCSPTRSLDRRPAKPTSPAPLPPCTPIHATCRLLRNRPISRSERHLKTTSTPEIRASDSGSVKDVRRPWSEVYCEVEARNLLAQSNCQSVPNFPQFEGTASGEQGATSFFHRLSYVRATDSMLQKFRKTFSLRFQRAARGRTETSSGSPAASGLQTASAEAEGDALDRSFGSSCHLADQSADSSSLAAGQTETGLFRLGFRSSRERKKGKSKQARGSKCNSADSGIQVEATCASSDGTNEANSAEESPAVVRRQTTFQEQDGALRNDQYHVTDLLADETLTSVLDHEGDSEKERNLGDVFQELDTFNIDDKLFTPVKRTPSVERQMSTPPPIKVRSERIRPKIRRQKVRARLRRSISQPLDLEKMGVHHKNLDHGFSDHEGSREVSTASSEEDFSSDNEGGFHLTTTALPKQTTFRDMYEDTVTFAEALWDHVTIDPEELPFKAGEVIEVTDSSDKDWWWGAIGSKSGWFPAAFVRLRVSQEATVEDCILRMTEGTLGVRHCQPRKMSVSLLSNEQVRANIVKEIVTTERDFVRHLKDVVEGYLSQVRHRPDMFTEEHVSTIFGNIEDIYQFQSVFLKHLESSINWQLPHMSEIGHCFLLHKDRFRIYSEYCNNHPLAVSQLQELYADPKYVHFFEACRLLQEMIDISLDGFLLTPVQKICKYPLQLAELLKYTRHDHADYQLVLDALGAMRGVAQLVNERKRRMECVERIIEWQKNIEGWEDGDLIDSSSMLIHSGEVTRVTSSWSRDLALFLFDHTIVYCKKDLLKRNIHVYRGRINLDHCCVFDVEDGKDAQFGITVRNAWKIHCNSRDKWFLFYAKSPLEKSRWLQAFREERQQVMEDRDQGFRITEQDKKAAKLAVLNKSKVKRPRAKIPKGPRPHPDTAVVEILLDPSGPKTRSGSLPSNLNPAVVVNGNAQAIPPKKKGSGWFHFGSGKKSKK